MFLNFGRKLNNQVSVKVRRLEVLAEFVVFSNI